MRHWGIVLGIILVLICCNKKVNTSDDTEIIDSPKIILSTTSILNQCRSCSDTIKNILVLSSVGADSIFYNITFEADWIACSPMHGSITTKSDTICIFFLTEQLDPGNYSTTMTIVDIDSIANSQTLNLNLEILSPLPWVCGDTLIDERDGQKYATVNIGGQCWMAENLNIGISIAGSLDQKNNGVIEKYIYDDIEAYADTFGALYQWDEAMQYSSIEGTQGICPLNWHIPTDDEWKMLELFLGMSQQQVEKSGERGFDEANQIAEGGTSGFEALISGYRVPYDNYFMSIYTRTNFWTSTITDNSFSWAHGIDRVAPGTFRGITRFTSVGLNGYCIRCIRDQ